MGHHFDGIEGAHRRIGGCTASLFHFYDRLLFTPDSYSRPTLIHARLLFTPGFDLRLVIICGQLLVTANSYLPLASITVFNAKLGARYLPQPALF
jgi:hypothetical protein